MRIKYKTYEYIIKKKIRPTKNVPVQFKQDLFFIIRYFQRNSNETHRLDNTVLARNNNYHEKKKKIAVCVCVLLRYKVIV